LQLEPREQEQEREREQEQEQQLSRLLSRQPSAKLVYQLILKMQLSAKLVHLQSQSERVALPVTWLMVLR